MAANRYELVIYIHMTHFTRWDIMRTKQNQLQRTILKENGPSCSPRGSSLSSILVIRLIWPVLRSRPEKNIDKVVDILPEKVTRTFYTKALLTESVNSSRQVNQASSIMLWLQKRHDEMGCKIDMGPLPFLRWPRRHTRWSKYFKNWVTDQNPSINKDGSRWPIFLAHRRHTLKVYLVPLNFSWIEQILLIEVQKTGLWCAAPSGEAAT